jgi:hypothetical protein
MEDVSCSQTGRKLLLSWKYPPPPSWTTVWTHLCQKTSASVFAEIDKMKLKFISKYKEPRVAIEIWKKGNKVKAFLGLNFLNSKSVTKL